MSGPGVREIVCKALDDGGHMASMWQPAFAKSNSRPFPGMAIA